VTWLRARFISGGRYCRGSGIAKGSAGKPALETSRGTRVFRHSQVIEDQADIASEFSHFLSDTAHALSFDDSDGKASEAGNVFRAIAGAYPAAVFIKIPVQDVVATVFDAPVATIDGKELLGICLLRFSAGDAVGDVMGDLSGPLFYRFSLDHENLLHVGEIEIVVEFGSGPDFSSFDPAVIRGIESNKIRIFSVLEIQFDIFKECGLVAFDRKVIMGLTLQAQIIGELALRQ